MLAHKNNIKRTFALRRILIVIGLLSFITGSSIIVSLYYNNNKQHFQSFITDKDSSRQPLSSSDSDDQTFRPIKIANEQSTMSLGRPQPQRLINENPTIPRITPTGTIANTHSNAFRPVSPAWLTEDSEAKRQADIVSPELSPVIPTSIHSAPDWLKDAVKKNDAQDSESRRQHVITSPNEYKTSGGSMSGEGYSFPSTLVSPKMTLTSDFVAGDQEISLFKGNFYVKQVKRNMYSNYDKRFVTLNADGLMKMYDDRIGEEIEVIDIKNDQYRVEYSDDQPFGFLLDSDKVNRKIQFDANNPVAIKGLVQLLQRMQTNDVRFEPQEHKVFIMEFQGYHYEYKADVKELGWQNLLEQLRNAILSNWLSNGFAYNLRQFCIRYSCLPPEQYYAPLLCEDDKYYVVFARWSGNSEYPMLKIDKRIMHTLFKSDLIFPLTACQMS